MKAEELRIGNYINWEQTTHIVSGLPNLNFVRSYWVKDDIVKDQEEYQGFIEEAKPIPLDEDWLLKFGFEFQEDESPRGMKLYVNNDWSFCILEEFGTFSYAETQGEDYEYFDVKCLRTVHQLQNLYYALTGEELTINEI